MNYVVVMIPVPCGDVSYELAPGVTEAPKDAIPLIDRDGTQYVGRCVKSCSTYTEASGFIATALRIGELPDGTPVPTHSLRAFELARRPNRKRLRFA